jgi:Mn-dependent DtxR family transcriptional regulator
MIAFLLDLIYIITMMKKEEYLKAIGKRLLATREKSRVLQGDLAKQLDISRVKSLLTILFLPLMGL